MEHECAAQTLGECQNLPGHPLLDQWYRILVPDWRMRHEPEEVIKKKLVLIDSLRGGGQVRTPECLAWCQECFNIILEESKKESAKNVEKLLFSLRD